MKKKSEARKSEAKTNMPNSKPSRIRAIVTDPQLWLPIAVLIVGIGVLVMVR